MKKFSVVSCALLLGAGLSWAQGNSTASQTNTTAKPQIAPRAEALLRSACQFLAQTPYFSVTAEIWREHVRDSGEKVQFTRTLTMEVKRPNRLHAEVISPHTQRGFWYDGQELTILDRKENLFSATPMPANLDKMLDTAHDEFGVDLPLMDLALSDPYQSAMARVRTATDFGESSAMGYNCQHLAFTQDNIDWQLWIQDGPQPFIRKLVITHKNEPGAPEFTALLKSWDITERIADASFVFTAPPGALKIPMRKHELASNGAGTPQHAAPVISPHSK